MGKKRRPGIRVEVVDLKNRRPALTVANILAVIVIFFVSGYLLGQNKVGLLPPAKAIKNPKDQVALQNLNPLVNRLKPSVVYVVVSGNDDKPDERVPENHPDLPPDEQKGVGSGFVIDTEGHILTNDHVVADAKKVEVVMGSGKKYTAKVIGRDPQLDVALIKIEPREELAPVKLGNSAEAKVGQWVLAMGNPFGLENNVTVGVISGKGRELAEAPFVDFLQTDAAIYPGNSGGPLIDLDGTAIGINTAVVPGTQLGFSVPINKVKEILPQLKRSGRVTRGYIGIEMGAVAPDQVPEQAAADKGARVVKVREGGPAAKAGIKNKDIIVAFDGKSVVNPNDLAKLVARVKPGKTVNVKVERDNQDLTIKVTVGRGPIPGESGQ